MKVDIPYGRGTVTVEVGVPLTVLEPRTPQVPDQMKVLEDALFAPVDAVPFREWAEGAQKLMVLVNDGTRPTPTAQALRALKPVLDTVAELSFMVATGTHRHPTREELGRIFGGFLQEYRDRILVHEAKDERMHESVGTTSRGTDARFDRRVLGAGKVVAINSVEPHYFAGYTGGRKSFLPGVAWYDTVSMNHRHAVEEGSVTMGLEGNPVHEDMEEAVRLLGDAGVDMFGLQLVVTGERRIFAAEAGCVPGSFHKAVKRADELYTVPLGQKGSIVVTCGPHAKQVSLYQAQHIFENGTPALEDGGILILVTRCWDGVGNDEFLRFLDVAPTLEAAEAVPEDERNFGFHKACRIMRLARKAELWAVTGLPPSEVARSRMRPFSDVQEALDAAVDSVREKGMEPRVIILPNATMALPALKEG